MASTLLRYGLWVILLVLVAYVLRETFQDQAFSEMIPEQVLEKAGAFGLLLLAAGAITAVIEKVFRKQHSKCAICKTKIPYGEIYCRAHLREILEEEDLRLHKTSTRLRRPDGF
jgi:predicted nucleic acid-binding Zn ribbon protein